MVWGGTSNRHHHKAGGGGWYWGSFGGSAAMSVNGRIQDGGQLEHCSLSAFWLDVMTCGGGRRRRRCYYEDCLELLL